MSRSTDWLRVIFLSTLVLTVGLAAQAATTVLHIQVGDSFNGDITAGVDTVDARFNAAAGTTIKIAAKAMRGSNLQPSITVKDPNGAVLSGGQTSRISWLPVAHTFHYFTVPSDGNYTATIGGTAGAGQFTGSVTGRVPSGTQMVTLSGTVTDSVTSAGLPGVTVTVGPFILITNASGAYSGSLPAGNYMVTVNVPDYDAFGQMVDVTGAATQLNIPMVPFMPFDISAGFSGDAVPGGVLTGNIDVVGTTITSVTWTQVGGVPALIAGAGTETPTVTLGSRADYKAELFDILREPPVGPDELPPNVPFPTGEFVGGLQPRFQVVGVNPFSLEETGLVVLEAEITTPSGVFTEEVEIHTALPWKVAGGIRNVPVNAPVLLYGKEQAAYDWALTPPAGSIATLTDATARNPEFTPDVPGRYDITVTDLAAAGDAPLTLQVFAGNWRGVVVGQDINNRPVPDPGCMVCHGGFAPDKFTPWTQTGHAEIFTNMLDTNSRYGSSCFPCHTVGYDPGAANSGVDDAPDWNAFLNGGLLQNPGDNWTQMLADYPDSARLSNIQCENCHGPQSAAPGRDNRAHGWNAPQGEPRVDLSAEVCAVCHGEPLRHARFQQWQLSGHANYELAFDRSESGNCSRCHSANGFLAWLPVLLDDDPATDPLDDVEVTWTEDDSHPQTCVVCHDPHNIGTTSGNNTNVNIRVSDDTPPLIAGFQALDVGRGAMCITCHNSRRGLRNDSVFGDYAGTSEAVRASHGGAQGDVLMGQNAYLISVPRPGSHSTLEDTCVTCHMQQTAPPDVLSYNQGGANHTFYASTEICGQCHQNFDAEDVQDGIEDLLHDVEDLLEDAWVDVMDTQIQAGNRIDFGGGVVITDVAQIAEAHFGETRGGQGLGLTLTDTTEVRVTRFADIRVRNAAGVEVGRLYIFGAVNLQKAGWNYTLFHNDKSKGAHNPFFAYEGLTAARNALWELAGISPAVVTEAPEWIPGKETADRPRARTPRRR